jgi:hypothetical protein
LRRLICHSNVRIFVSSRDEVDVPQFLKSCLHIHISEDNITADIRSYVEREVTTNIANKRTNATLLIDDIKTSLIKGSQGM